MEGNGRDTSAPELQRTLDRLVTQHAFAVLGVDVQADAAAIRAAFLAATKKYHPSRYARQDREVRRLANEVFLRIKEAYTLLSNERAASRLREQLAPSDRQPAASQADPVTQRGAAPRPRPRPDRPSVPKRAATAVGTGSAGPARRPRPASPRGATMPGIPPVKTGAPPPGRSKPTTDSRELEANLRDTVRARNEAFERALELTVRGRFADARGLLQQIAAADPKTKKFRLHMHYVWGLEHEEAGRFDDARAELQRAITIDPEFRRAHEALDRLPGKKGIFSKLFGR